MGNAEHFESIKAADSIKEGAMNNLSGYTMERSVPVQAKHEQNNGLVEQGILPSVSLMEFSSDVRPGTPASAAEIKESGVKVEHGKDGSTVGHYPSGVKIESTPASQSHNPNVVLEPTLKLESEAPNHMNKNGDVVDPKGRIIAKMNPDGSVTVDSGKGFYTQYPDGSIDRESAIRTRDGKNFDVIPTSTPLGDLRPSDMAKH
ncbi:MAG TPA: hypothetical protein V6C72_06050 [Chroococcales cyanobacterium]